MVPAATGFQSAAVPRRVADDEEIEQYRKLIDLKFQSAAVPHRVADSIQPPPSLAELSFRAQPWRAGELTESVPDDEVRRGPVSERSRGAQGS